MMDKLQKLMDLKKKKSGEMPEMEKSAKMSVLKDLVGQASHAMADSIPPDGFKKVEVLANDKHGLEAGLDKAKDLIASAEHGESNQGSSEDEAESKDEHEMEPHDESMPEGMDESDAEEETEPPSEENAEDLDHEGPEQSQNADYKDAGPEDVHHDYHSMPDHELESHMQAMMAAKKQRGSSTRY